MCMCGPVRPMSNGNTPAPYQLDAFTGNPRPLCSAHVPWNVSIFSLNYSMHAFYMMQCYVTAFTCHMQVNPAV